MPTPLTLTLPQLSNPIDAVGIGFELSATDVGGVDIGVEYVYFLNGTYKNNLYAYYKGGFNVGEEASAGAYVFAASFMNGTAGISPESWTGWFNSYSGGAGEAGLSLFLVKYE